MNKPDSERYSFALLNTQRRRGFFWFVLKERRKEEKLATMRCRLRLLAVAVLMALQHERVVCNNVTTVCEAGHYRGNVVQKYACLSCTGGRFQEKRGATSCDLCPGGYYSGDGETSCTACSDGQYRPALQDGLTCLPCKNICATGNCESVDGKCTNKPPQCGKVLQANMGENSRRFVSQPFTNCKDGYGKIDRTSSSLIFELVVPNDDFPFTVDTCNGDVKPLLTASFNFEARSLYSATVKVKDTRPPKMESTVDLLVYIDDENEKPTVKNVAIELFLDSGATRFQPPLADFFSDPEQKSSTLEFKSSKEFTQVDTDGFLVIDRGNDNVQEQFCQSETASTTQITATDNGGMSVSADNVVLVLQECKTLMLYSLGFGSDRRKMVSVERNKVAKPLLIDGRFPKNTSACFFSRSARLVDDDDDDDDDAGPICVNVRNKTSPANVRIPKELTGIIDVYLTDDAGSLSTRNVSLQVFARPTVVRVEPNTGRAVGGYVVTVTVSYVDDLRPGIESLHLGDLPCTEHIEVSDGVYSCTVPPGVGSHLEPTFYYRDMDTDFRFTSAVADATVEFSYMMPTIQYMVPQTLAIVGGRVSLRGSNFGPASLSSFKLDCGSGTSATSAAAAAAAPPPPAATAESSWTDSEINITYPAGPYDCKALFGMERGGKRWGSNVERILQRESPLSLSESSQNCCRKTARSQFSAAIFSAAFCPVFA